MSGRIDPVLTAQQFRVLRECILEESNLQLVEASLAKKLQIPRSQAEYILHEVSRHSPKDQPIEALTINKMHSLRMFSTQTLKAFVALFKTIAEFSSMNGHPIEGLESDFKNIYGVDLFLIADNIMSRGAYMYEEQLLSRRQTVSPKLIYDQDEKPFEIGHIFLMHFDRLCEALKFILLHEQNSNQDSPEELRSTFERAAHHLMRWRHKLDYVAKLMTPAMKDVMQQVCQCEFDPQALPVGSYGVVAYLRTQGVSSRQLRRIIRSWQL